MDKVPSQSSTRPRFRYASMDERMRLQHQHLHQRLQIRQQAPQSKLRELHPKGSLRLLCASYGQIIALISGQMAIIGGLGQKNRPFYGRRRHNNRDLLLNWAIPDCVHMEVSLSGISSLRSDIPCTSPVGPLQAERLELTLHYKSLTLRDFVAALRHPSPPAAGRCKAQIKKSRSSKLDATFLFVLCGE